MVIVLGQKSGSEFCWVLYKTTSLIFNKFFTSGAACQVYIFGPPNLVGLGPMKFVLSVLSVCLPVCDTLLRNGPLVFSDLLHKCSKVMEPEFSKKISFAQIWAKRAQNG